MPILCRFQFHKGTIRTGCLLIFGCAFHYFNSIKVRLELSVFIHFSENYVFQFHKGTIRTKSRFSSCSPFARFQFHKGTIRTGCLLIFGCAFHYFNSIKVRLELSVFIHFSENYVFQFHKGTIRTKSRFSSCSPFARFQFHKGTIRTIPSAVVVSALFLFQFHKGTIRTMLS